MGLAENSGLRQMAALPQPGWRGRSRRPSFLRRRQHPRIARPAMRCHGGCRNIRAEGASQGVEVGPDKSRDRI